MSRRPREVILRPIFTEKSAGALQYEGTDAGGRRLEKLRDRGVEPRPKYTFAVAPNATKIEIRQAFEQLFEGSRVTSVRTMNVRGKKKRMGRTTGRRPHWKKAIVEVAGGAIDLVEGA
ncbi:MAG: 50S ribosomal protein L23 [Gemmatimonadota bacterium]